ncbi:family 78 glycoside hydrolase catalytic domain [Nesterenkonia pannonica]|uniref:family 78 glycoside hydrolase catalytic domain n=1 Tax=Nesterenkonia pannonica TaxID=1548602 RepID=UPI0021649ECA|nr:family 78 glycoside hydrolase catalytic domain [Nesterenkonia pannonica]
MTLNGSAISGDVLSPGWSSYEWRLRYQTYEVTDLLDPAAAEQVVSATIGNGWYRGRLGWEGMRHVYGDRRGLLLQLDMLFEDGHVETICSDETWIVEASEVLADDLYDGQSIDARRRSRGTPGKSVSRRKKAQSTQRAERISFRGELVEQLGPPVRRHESIAPEAIWQSPAGKTLVDFGQNLVGWVRLHVQGPEGRVVTLRHAEVLEDEELGTRPLRSARATDQFTLSGEADIFEPSFTFHGFRYVEVTGFPGVLEPHHLSAVVVHSQLERTGTFTTSNELLNSFHRNVVWGLRGNFLDVPTDCPQRDERLGWTGTSPCSHRRPPISTMSETFSRTGWGPRG